MKKVDGRKSVLFPSLAEKKKTCYKTQLEDARQKKKIFFFKKKRKRKKFFF